MAILRMKNNMKKFVKENYIPLIIWLLCFLGSMYFVGKYGDELLDSDQAAELILASKLKGFDILCEDWYYSTSIRIFDIQLFYKIGLLFFPNNWMLAMTAGHTIMFILYSICFYLLAHKIVGSKLSILFAALLLCPFSKIYEFHVIESSAYLPYILLVLIAAIFSIEIINECYRERCATKKVIICAIIYALVSFVSGLAGVRIAMCFYVPFVFTAGIMFIYRVRTLPSDKITPYVKNSIRALASHVPVYLMYMVGYIINTKVLAQKYSFKDWTTVRWRHLSFVDLLESLDGYLTGFGYPFSDYFENLTDHNVNLFSLTGILGAFGVCIVIIYVVSTIRLFKRFGEISSLQQIILVLQVVAAATIGFFQTQVEGTPNEVYYLPMMPLAIMVIAIELDTERFVFKWSRKVLTAFFCVCIFLSSTYHAKLAVSDPVHTGSYLRDISCRLNDMGYTKGVAWFWESDVITAWSNGKIEMWTVLDLENLEPMQWGQIKSHVVLPEEDYFMISKCGDEAAHYSEKYDKEIVYENGMWAILY